MFFIPFSITAVWKLSTLPSSGYFNALGGLTCSKVGQYKTWTTDYGLVENTDSGIKRGLSIPDWV